jgi:hypothetical protein
MPIGMLEKKHRILYVGPIGTNWIHECVPDGATISFLPLTRISARHFYTSTLVFFFINFIRDFTYLIRHPRALIRFSILDSEKKDMVLSLSDNWPWLQEYGARRSTPVVLIQNAARRCLERRKKFRAGLPIYLGWGQLEKDVFDSCGIALEQFESVGSLKLGIACARYQSTRSQEHHDIVFISQFRPSAGFRDQSGHSDSVDSLISTNQLKCFAIVKSFAKSHNRKVSIISKTRGPEHYPLEKHYFQDGSDYCDFSFVKGDKTDGDFDTYYACFGSNLIITMNSSLGFEMLAAGKKVIFCAPGLPNYIDEIDVRPYFDALPAEVKLASLSLSEFNDKVRAIETLSEPELRSLIERSMRPIINFDRQRLPQTLIKEVLSKHLGSPSLN